MYIYDSNCFKWPSRILGVRIPKIQMQEVMNSRICLFLIYMATNLMTDSGEAVLHLLTTLTSEGILTKDPVGNVRTSFSEKDR